MAATASERASTTRAVAPARFAAVSAVVTCARMGQLGWGTGLEEWARTWEDAGGQGLGWAGASCWNACGMRKVAEQPDEPEERRRHAEPQ